MKAFATICFGLLVSSACVAGGTVDGLVDILHRRKLEQLRKIRKVEVVNELIEKDDNFKLIIDNIKSKIINKE